MSIRAESRRSPDDEITLLAVGTVLLRNRHLLVSLVLVGAAIGTALALSAPPRYVSTASFIPRDADIGNSELVSAASQFGIRLPSTGSGWGPAVYVEVLRSQAVLEPIALDSVTVDGRRVRVMDVLAPGDGSPERRLDLTVRALRRMITVSEQRAIRGVQITVATRWPTVSLELARSALRGVNQFNLEVRKSQAVAERQFVESQVAQATADLATAEARLRDFLERNRSIGQSLMFERDRLQREVSLRRELHTNWLKNREDARIREVRDTPVITILEEPRMAIAPEPRGTVVKAGLGAFAGFLLGLFIALMRLLADRASAAGDSDAREFFQLVHQVQPRFLRRIRGAERRTGTGRT